MSVNSASDRRHGRRRFERYALAVWAVTMLAFLGWLLTYAALEFRPSG